jgi:tetraacyldisaccharide 4'-kinase
MALDAAYRSLVSGQWKGPLAAALRGCLGLLELPYGWIVRRRNARFDCGENRSQRVAAPVISVGNITVGGTGKTPFVAWLARWFLARQQAVTIISRGYGSPAGRPNDEALELAARLPGVPHLQNPDRIAAARAALAAKSRQVLILDDAFQHRRLARDLDMVLLDALEPFGYERVLPRGLLREPLTSLDRAQVIALSRSDAVSEVCRREIEARARSFAPQATWLELTHRPVRFVSADGESLELTELRGTCVAVFCGIGNPNGFRHTLSGCGLEVAAALELPDHCGYGKRELSGVQNWLAAINVEHVICTRKDLVKIPRVELAGKRLWALDIELEIVRGQAELEGMLDKLAGQVARMPEL